MTAKKMRALSDAEETIIQRQIEADPDNPEWTDEELAQARPLAEVLPDLAAAMRKNLGGRPRSDNPKQAVSLRLDAEVISRFKAGGPGWQSRMNEALRRSVGLKG
ncbi:MAG: BrnA antitoxin family protein [Phreatobacter sp.]|uniref:BrnA antitoxin family protein n=1 Tax=Phreatobacter sp. TaxID=1966341 RepID=UPI001A509493|nr:BrnA antitoxin family protein [Phreatobacter sp.]MBL8571435.1 BrnA antitoxin family protein [Phreatobacter sp.]